MLQFLVMKYLRKYQRDLFIIIFAFFIPIFLTYIFAFNDFLRQTPCTMQQEMMHAYGRGCSLREIYVSQIRFFSQSFPSLLIYFSQYLSLYALFITGICIGLMGGKKWLFYAYIVGFLVVVPSDDMRSIFWPHPEGAGKAIRSLEMANEYRFRHLMNLLYDVLPAFLLIICFGGGVGRFLFTILSLSTRGVSILHKRFKTQ